MLISVGLPLLLSFLHLAINEWMWHSANCYYQVKPVPFNSHELLSQNLLNLRLVGLILEETLRNSTSFPEAGATEEKAHVSFMCNSAAEQVQICCCSYFNTSCKAYVCLTTSWLFADHVCCQSKASTPCSPTGRCLSNQENIWLWLIACVFWVATQLNNDEILTSWWQWKYKVVFMSRTWRGWQTVKLFSADLLFLLCILHFLCG